MSKTGDFQQCPHCYQHHGFHSATCTRPDGTNGKTPEKKPYVNPPHIAAKTAKATPQSALRWNEDGWLVLDVSKPGAMKRLRDELPELRLGKERELSNG